MYSPKLLDHFEHPRNAGEIDHPDIAVQLENPACGDVLRLTLSISGARVSEARFRARGCVPTMACGSAVTELAMGKCAAEIGALRVEHLVQALGGLPEASTHAAQLAIDVLMQAMRQLANLGARQAPVESGK